MVWCSFWLCWYLLVIFYYSWSCGCSMFSVEVAKVSGRQGKCEVVGRHLAQALVLPLRWCRCASHLTWFPQGLDSSPGLLSVSQLKCFHPPVQAHCLRSWSTCQSPARDEGRTSWKIGSIYSKLALWADLERCPLQQPCSWTQRTQKGMYCLKRWPSQPLSSLPLELLRSSVPWALCA